MAALVLGVVAAAMNLCWFVGLVRVTWKIARVDIKHHVFVVMFWWQSLRWVCCAVAAILAFRWRAGSVGFPTKWIAAIGFFTYWMNFAVKDWGRDWAKDISVGPLHAEFNEVCIIVGWGTLCWACRAGMWHRKLQLDATV